MTAGRDTRTRRGWLDTGPSATVFAVDRRRLVLAAFALLVAWAFFRPKAIACPQCKGRGAPPLLVNGEARARVCATCGASSTPDLPLVGEEPRSPDELREMMEGYVDREGPIE